jgi:HTH-type transcriptional regulator, glycine betaine synthesis regulator
MRSGETRASGPARERELENPGGWEDRGPRTTDRGLPSPSNDSTLLTYLTPPPRTECSFSIEQIVPAVRIAAVILTAEAKPPVPSTEQEDRATRLDPLQIEVIDLFVQLSRLLGQPRSLAEIYGLLFISARPLAMDDLIDRLELSKGTASQGLKYLRNLGAVRMVYVAGDRRVHYEAVAELRNLATRFLREQIVPHLDSGQARIDRIATMVKQLPPENRAQVLGRVKMLQSWERNGRRFLPMLAKMLGP